MPWSSQIFYLLGDVLWLIDQTAKGGPQRYFGEVGTTGRPFKREATWFWRSVFDSTPHLHGLDRKPVVGEAQVRHRRLVPDQSFQNHRDGLIPGFVSIQIQRA